MSPATMVLALLCCPYKVFSGNNELLCLCSRPNGIRVLWTDELLLYPAQWKSVLDGPISDVGDTLLSDMVLLTALGSAPCCGLCT